MPSDQKASHKSSGILKLKVTWKEAYEFWFRNIEIFNQYFNEILKDTTEKISI